MAVTEALQSLTRRERLLILASLIVMTLAGWGYLLHLAGQMGDMAGTSEISGTAIAPGFASWSWVDALAMFVMWALMMVAMMLPSAAPMILLYAALRTRSGDGAVAHTGLFTLGYVAIWAGFSISATFLQWMLERAALLSPMMTANSDLLGGALLILAGVYQATPYKNRCLSHCRAPAQFLSTNWRTGSGGAFHMGLAHGLFCLGCCWAVMLLLFVGGVMNLLWIAILAAFVLIEKIVPRGLIFARSSGVLMVLVGVWLMIQT